MGDPLQVLDAHAKYALPLAFTRNGKTLVTGGFDGTLRTWTTNDWRPTSVLAGHDQSVNAGCIAAGGLLVTGSTDTTLRVWDLTEEDPRAVLRGHKKTITSVHPHPKKAWVASASYDATVRLWDLDDEDEIALLSGHKKNVLAVRFLDEDTLVSAGLGGEAIVWDIDDGEEIARVQADPTAVAGLVVDEGRGFWTAGHQGAVRHWQRDGTEAGGFELPSGVAPTGIALAANTGRLAITKDHGVLVYTVDGQEVDAHELKPKGVYAPHYSHDGRTLAVGGADGKVRVYTA